MDEQAALRQRVYEEQRLTERLRLAAFRLAAAQEERTWAIVAAHQQGLTIRRIAAATGLSATRVHQLLAASTAAAIPVWLSRLRERGGVGGAADEGAAPGTDAAWRGQVAAEVAACGAAATGWSKMRVVNPSW